VQLAIISHTAGLYPPIPVPSTWFLLRMQAFRSGTAVALINAACGRGFSRPHGRTDCHHSGDTAMQKVNVIGTVLGIALLASSGIAAAAHHVYNEDDEMLALSGEWEIGNAETQTITQQKKDETYRICVNKSRLTVPVKVTYDGKEQKVAGGNCADFEAMNIQIMPAGKLEKDSVLIGKYHRLKD
jgi:hypothetical protein